MKTLVEGCRNNMPTGTYAIVEELQKNPDIDYIVYGCLGDCSRCARNPFLFVEGELVEGQTKEELKKQLEKQL